VEFIPLIIDFRPLELARLRKGAATAISTSERAAFRLQIKLRRAGPGAQTAGMPQMFIVIIAGGRGERFWPQSRARRPKHLLPIVGDEPLLTQTLARVLPVVPATQILVITGATQAKAVAAVCLKAGVPAGNVHAEPVGRDTAAAVGLGAALVAARDPAGVFAVLPADHVIRDAGAYRKDLRAAFTAAAGHDLLVTIGIAPHEPATGFGYLRRGKKWKTVLGRPLYHVARFAEKPPLATARKYLAAGDWFWNAGMFVWSVHSITRAFERHAPVLFAALAPVREALALGLTLGPVLRKVYPGLEKISVDYAILEKSTNVAMVPASFDWDDVGTWPAVVKHVAADVAGNVSRGHAVVEQGRNNLVFAEGGHLVAVLGLDDLVVVQTPDATLICPKGRAQDLKALLKQIEASPAGQRWL
jgi:mannose-1-phosphate guanylyltransferase